jgi:hypothetical protein
VSIATIFCHATFWALMTMLAYGVTWWTAGVFAAVLAIRIGVAATIIRLVLKMPELTRDVWMVPLKDLAATIIWAASLAGNEVEWAGERFRIQRDGTMRVVSRKDPPAGPAVHTSHRTV